MTEEVWTVETLIGFVYSTSSVGRAVLGERAPRPVGQRLDHRWTGDTVDGDTSACLL